MPIIHNTHEKLSLKDEEQLLETLHINFCTYIQTIHVYVHHTHTEEVEL